MTSPIFDETRFVADILDEYYENDMNDSCAIIFEKHFNVMVERYDIKEIIKSYCSTVEIEDARERYSTNYIEAKLNLVLFDIVINAITTCLDSDAETDICE